MGSILGDMSKKAKGPGAVSLESLKAQLEGTEVLAKRPDGLDAFVCTHHGTFHCDEVMACVMLKCLDEFQSLPILRTRDAAEIDKATIVVDVGGTYEPEKQRFDHHQKTFTETYSEAYSGIKLSSAGLVFKHFGGKVVEALCGPLEEKAKAAIVAKTYDNLVRELDALDNGVQVADEPRYRIVTHLGARVGRLNPSWQEENSPEVENQRFKEAMLVAAKELCDIVGGYAQHWLPARSLVEEALHKRKEVHPSCEIMTLEQFCPWQDHLFDLEEEEEEYRSPLVKYVIFQDSRAGWRVQAAPKTRGSFELRQGLPSAWRGVRDDELSKLSEIPGCIFVHAAGFIGGNVTKEGALAMATKALE